PGSGKSTFAQFVSLGLRRAMPTIWHHEDEPGSIRDGFAPDRWPNLDAYEAHRIAAWEETVQLAQTDDDVWLMESALLQVPVLTLLLEGVAPARIERLLNRTCEVVGAARPLLVYLHPLDVPMALRRACESRYPGLLEQYIARNDNS